MAESEADSSPIILQIISDSEGRVFMLYEPGGLCLEVRRPVSQETLDEARTKMEELSKQQDEATQLKREGADAASANVQQLANREIKKAVEPPAGRFVKFAIGMAVSAFKGSLAVLIAGITIVIGYKSVELSQSHLPEVLHVVVLFLYAIGLAVCIYLMVTIENRREKLNRIEYWFGPYGLIFLPSLTLVTAAAVFASITLTLHNHGLLIMLPCAGRPVAQGSLIDFYMYHFLHFVPVLKLNEVLKLGEPLCYTQARVGFLILLFEGLVVLPSINTVRFYLKNRKSLTAKNYKYAYNKTSTD